MRLRLCAVGLVCGLLGGCQKQEPPTVPMDVPAVPAPSNTVPREGPAAASPPVHRVEPASAPDAGDAPGSAGPGTGGVRTAGNPPGVDSTGAMTGDAAPDAGGDRAWTTEAVEKPRSAPPAVVLRSVRTGTHADYDRTVFEFDGPRLPGYHLAYVKTPVQDCGSGDDVKTAGGAALEVRFTLAQAHTEAGQATVAQRTLKPALPSVLQLDRLCDFEGEVTWVLSAPKRAPFRVLELREPTRLVLDVQH